MYRALIVSSRDVEIFSRGRTDYLPDDKTLFLLGGRAPDPEWLLDLAVRNSTDVWAVDRGVHSCRAAGLVPSVLIGDGDSASPEDWKWALSRGASEKLYDRDKDETDFQLAITLFEDAIRLDAPMPALIVSGCFGGALDHLMSNFYTSAFGSGNFFRCMIDETEGAFFIFSEEKVTLEFSRTPEAVSLIPVTDNCAGVGISGVRWPLSDVALERKYLWTISNEVIPDVGSTSSSVAVRCKKGILAVYWRF
jgi:thiamine pyrophosphokinase